MEQATAVIAHFDIAGDDVATLGSFYGNLFGWDVTLRGPGYAQIGTPNLRGAIVETPEASLTLGVVVSDLEATLARAALMGGTIAMPATDNGWVRKGQVRDPAGNLLTLIQQ